MALALGLRLWGLAWSLPWPVHPDERIPVDQARAMVASADLDPEYFKNPSLFTYLIASELLVTQRLGSLAGPLAPDTPGSTHLLARLNSALLGTTSVAVIYAVGATLLGRQAGLVAALYLAVSFIHVRNSHYGVNDVPAVGLLVVSLYFASRLLRQPTLRWYVLAGLTGGLATSTKYSMGFFFAPILVAHCFASFGPGQQRWGRWGCSALIIAAASSLAGYVLGTPYTVLDFGDFWTDFSKQYSYGNGRWLGQPPDPVPWLYLTSLLQGFGTLALVLSALGLLLAVTSPWRRYRRWGWPAEALVLLAFPVTYLAFLLPKDVFFPRLVLPLVPFCSLLAGYGTLSLARRLVPIRLSIGLAAVLMAALAQPLMNDIRHNRLLLQANTRVLATEWVVANVPPGSSVEAEFRSIMDESTDGTPYPPGRPPLRVAYLEGRPELDDADDYANRDVQYFVTSSHAYERLLKDPPLRSQRQSGQRYLDLHRSLDQEARLVATFGPGYGGRAVPYSQDEIFTPFWNLEQYERPGPTIRIYSLAGLATKRR